jgi:hypothetical protein
MTPSILPKLWQNGLKKQSHGISDAVTNPRRQFFGKCVGRIEKGQKT